MAARCLRPHIMRPRGRTRRLIARTLAAAAILAGPALVITSGLGPPIPAATRAEDVGFASDRLPRIHETVQRYLDAKQLAGAVTLVARRGRLAHFEAHGVMDFDSKV